MIEQSLLASLDQRQGWLLSRRMLLCFTNSAVSLLTYYLGELADADWLDDYLDTEPELVARLGKLLRR